jgi:hypothetical protein
MVEGKKSGFPQEAAHAKSARNSRLFAHLGLGEGMKEGLPSPSGGETRDRLILL